ncbi:MAG: hypothetical protein ACO2OR_01005 [Desulfurococcaceae archaeon]
MLLVTYRVLLTTRIRVFAYSLIVLTLLSWLSLVALGLVSSLLWLYEGVFGVGEGLVISSRGFSPLTALVYRSEIESRLANISGITVEYYLVAPVLLGDKVLVLRSTSSNLSGDCVLVGIDMARELGVTSGDYLLVSSLFTSEVYYLEVCGYTSGYVVEGSYDLVARIRGVSHGYYSYAVVRGPPEALDKALRALGVEPGEYKLAGLLVAVLSRVGNRTRAALYRALTEAYISGLGFQRDYILYFAYTVAVASVLGSLLLGLDVARRTSSVLGVFRLVGASRRHLTLVAVLLGLALSTIAFTASLLLYRHFEIFTLNIQGYVFKPAEPGVLALVVYSVLTLLYTLGLALGVHREVE